MPPSEALLRRVRKILETIGPFEEKRMVGGISFLLDDRLCCGVMGTDLLVRVRSEDRVAALQRPHVVPLRMGNREPKGFLRVQAPGIQTQPQLKRWVQQATLRVE